MNETVYAIKHNEYSNDGQALLELWKFEVDGLMNRTPNHIDHRTTNFYCALDNVSKSWHIRNLLIHRTRGYVAPVEYQFSAESNDKFYYIPLEKVLKAKLEKEYKYFNSEPVKTPYIEQRGLEKFVRLIIYGDDLGMVNPISYAQKKTQNDLYLSGYR